jgi:hypothetical protein
VTFFELLRTARFSRRAHRLTKSTRFFAESCAAGSARASFASPIACSIRCRIWCAVSPLVIFGALALPTENTPYLLGAIAAGLLCSRSAIARRDRANAAGSERVFLARLHACTCSRTQPCTPSQPHVMARYRSLEGAAMNTHSVSSGTAGPADGQRSSQSLSPAVPATARATSVLNEVAGDLARFVVSGDARVTTDSQLLTGKGLP